MITHDPHQSCHIHVGLKALAFTSDTSISASTSDLTYVTVKAGLTQAG